jgi:hypothetical protein
MAQIDALIATGERDATAAAYSAGGDFFVGEIKGIGKTLLPAVGTVLVASALAGAGLVSSPILAVGGGLILAASAGASIYNRFTEAQDYNNNTGRSVSGGRIAAAGISDLFGIGGGYTGLTNRSLLTDQYLGLSPGQLGESYGGGLGTGGSWLLGGSASKVGFRAGEAATAIEFHSPGATTWAELSPTQKFRTKFDLALKNDWYVELPTHGVVLDGPPSDALLHELSDRFATEGKVGGLNVQGREFMAIERVNVPKRGAPKPNEYYLVKGTGPGEAWVPRRLLGGPEWDVTTVHNHPAGNIQASEPDALQLARNVGLESSRGLKPGRGVSPYPDGVQPGDATWYISARSNDLGDVIQNWRGTSGVNGRYGYTARVIANLGNGKWRVHVVDHFGDDVGWFTTDSKGNITNPEYPTKN